MISRNVRNTSSPMITHAKQRRSFLNRKPETSRKTANLRVITLLGKFYMEALSKKITVSQKINFQKESDLLFFHTMLLATI